jgi:hypothetical protein
VVPEARVWWWVGVSRLEWLHERDAGCRVVRHGGDEEQSQSHVRIGGR